MDWLKFHLERLLLRGAHYRLLFMAVAVAAVALVGGVALNLLGEPESVGDGAWWAFLRLTDPGYLGDDEGIARRIVSLLVTVAGYVLFMGALIAILTQWLHETVTRLQRGETPIALRDHILVLGLTPRTPAVIEEIMRSEKRVERFLGRRGVSRLRVVVLVDALDERIRAELSERLGDVWDDRAIVLRSGSPLTAEHLDRVDFAQASVILMPGGVEPGEELSGRDATTIKTMLSIAHHPGIRGAALPPRLVAEVFDDRLIKVVESIYEGSIELIPNDAIVSRLMAQNLRHRGLSWVLSELLAFHNGNDLFYATFPELAGHRFADVALRVQGGVALGVLRGTGDSWVPHLSPPRDFVVRPGDRFVVVAREFDRIKLAPAPSPAAPAPRPTPPVGTSWPAQRRVLFLGWSRRIPFLIQELDTYTRESFVVDVVSIVPVESRQRAIERVHLGGPTVEVRHILGEYTDIRDITALDLGSYHNVVVFGRGWMLDGESSDAQTILAATILHASCEGLADRPATLIELTDPDNADLFDERPGELVLSPVFMAHVLAHVAIRPELIAILDELFTVGGAEFHYRAPNDYALADGRYTFSALQATALAHDELLIGVRVSDVALDVRGDLALAPEPDHPFELRADSLLLVLTCQDASVGGPD